MPQSFYLEISRISWLFDIQLVVRIVSDMHTKMISDSSPPRINSAEALTVDLVMAPPRGPTKSIFLLWILRGLATLDSR